MFTVGAIVQLKSGGPVMTVTGSDADGVGCLWFDARSTLQSGVFKPQTLKRVKAKT